MHRASIIKYTKLSAEELKKSASDPLSCVAQVQSNEILSLRPRDCEHIVKGVRRCVTDRIGRYHAKVHGIVLGYAKIRIENTLSAFRMDSPYLHVRATIDYYVFHPRLGSTLRGTVNYVSKAFVSAMIYKVFNATVKLNGDANKHVKVEKGSEISFIVKACDMKSEIPVIDGELVPNKSEQSSIDEPESVENGAASEEDVKPTIKVEKSDASDVEVTEKPKKAKTKRNKKILNEGQQPPEENLPATNGDATVRATKKASSAISKTDLIQSLLSDMFDDLDDEPSTVNRPRKNKSKNAGTPHRNGKTVSSKSNESGDISSFHVNGFASTPLVKEETPSGKRKKIRFDPNDKIKHIKLEPVESRT